MCKKIGIIGCGAVTQNNYVYAFQRLRHVKVGYVSDIDKKNAIKVKNIFNCEISNYPDLFKNSEYAIIATPPGTHFDLIKEGLNYNCKIICEKPFLTKYEEAIEIIKVATALNKKIFVAHFRRLYPSVELIKKLIEMQIFGKILAIEISEGGVFKWATKSGYENTNIFGGVLYDTGSHAIDMALYVTGLDRSKIDISIINVYKDKKEPSHEIKANFIISTKVGEYKFRIDLSRKQILSNQIKIKLQNATLVLKTEMSNQISIFSSNKNISLFAERSYKNILDCFTHQYHKILVQNDHLIFEAERFLNLTSILEKISKYECNL